MKTIKWLLENDPIKSAHKDLLKRASLSELFGYSTSHTKLNAELSNHSSPIISQMAKAGEVWHEGNKDELHKMMLDHGFDHIKQAGVDGFNHYHHPDNTEFEATLTPFKDKHGIQIIPIWQASSDAC